jgi:nanoRNase/pAp phosphatase (c-di-AMP/oligoRNAs hydrolase)
VIDQHLPLSKSEAKLLLIDQGCGATSVLLAKSVLAAKKELPPRVATALTYGILTDTRNLADARRSDIISTFMETLRFADLRILSRIMNPERSSEFIAAVGRGICGARILRKLLISHVGPVENPDVVSYVADYLVRAKGVEVCLCTGRYGSTLRISLRTTGSAMRADRLIRQVVDDPSQAGGHGGIAGGMIRFSSKPSEKEWTDKERALTRRLRAELQLPKRSRFGNAFGI